MIEAILNVASWFFLVSGVLVWVCLALFLWLYNMDRR